MTLYYTLTAADRVLAIHQTLAEARGFAKLWNASGAKQAMDRPAERIVSAIRDAGAVYDRSDRFNLAKAVERFTV